MSGHDVGVDHFDRTRILHNFHIAESMFLAEVEVEEHIKLCATVLRSSSLCLCLDVDKPVVGKDSDQPSELRSNVRIHERVSCIDQGIIDDLLLYSVRK